MEIHELITETLEWYETNPRGKKSSGACVYLAKSGAMCAVGRCLKPRVAKEWADLDFGSIGVTVSSEQLYDGLRPEYKDISFREWKHLQYFHDHDSHWTDENVVTDLGWIYLRTYFDYTKEDYNARKVDRQPE